MTRRGKAGWAVRPFLGTAIRGRGERRDGSRGVHAAARPPGDVVSERRVRVQDGGGSRTRTRPSSSPSPPRSRSIDPRRLARGPSPSTPRAFFSPLVDHHITSSFVAERRPADVRPPVRSLTSLLPAPPSLTTEPRGEARDRDALPRRGSPRHARPFVDSVQLRRAKLPFPRQVRARVALHRGGAHGPFRGRPRGDRAGDP